jgi:hypothetical protein
MVHPFRHPTPFWALGIYLFSLTRSSYQILLLYTFDKRQVSREVESRYKIKE